MVKNNDEQMTQSPTAIEIPNKKYFMIGEVAKMCQIKTHVLRYWEGQFPQLKPSKRRGRRYYQRQDVLLIIEIDHLLNHHRFTVEGAIAKLNEKSASSTALSDLATTQDSSSAVTSTSQSEDLDLIGLVGSLRYLIKECQQFQLKIKNEL